MSCVLNLCLPYMQASFHVMAGSPGVASPMLLSKDVKASCHSDDVNACGGGRSSDAFAGVAKALPSSLVPRTPGAYR